MLKVRSRGGFSDRNGIKPLNTEIQLTDFDDRTRARLMNLVQSIYNNVFFSEEWSSPQRLGFLRFIMDDVYASPITIDDLQMEDKVLSSIYETILKDDYDDVLTLIEAIAQYMDAYLTSTRGQQYIQEIGCIKVFRHFNDLFEKEYVGYRFLGDLISPISDKIEMETITKTLENPFSSVREHISKANHLLSDRITPDYENSIKESISAVEAMCQKILGARGKGASLGDMLKKLEGNGIEIHAALKTAFHSLFGYTSDAKGIRHAGNLGGPSSTFEEAKFMLVSCSAFINYLMGVNAKL